MSVNTIFTGKNWIELDSVDSTNNFAANLINQTNVPDGTVIMAHHQTAGKGQKGNTWHTDKSENLTVSIVFYPKFLSALHIFDFSMTVALAVRKTISEWVQSEKVFVKWPNDVMIQQDKIAGILIENQWKKNGLVSVAGIGINVNKHDFKGLQNVTSLRHFIKKETRINPKFVAETLAAHMEYYYLLLKRNPIEIRQLYLNHLLGYNQLLCFKNSKQQEFTATIKGVDREGKLILEHLDGNLKHYDIKEVSLNLNSVKD